MASKAKRKKRARLRKLERDDALRLVKQHQRAYDVAVGQMEFHRDRANQLQQAPVMTVEQKIDVEHAYQRGLEAGRAQRHDPNDLEREIGRALLPALNSVGEVERMAQLAAKELNEAYFVIDGLFKTDPSTIAAEPSAEP